MGYTIHAEVNSIDVVARQERTVVAIELKKDFTLQLIAQGAKRHKLTDFVYIAIPKPTTKVIRGSIFQDKLYLLKRLGIGLILIDVKKEPYIAKIHQEPVLTDIKANQSRNKKKRTSMLREIRERHGDYNIGGTRGKTVTAYREKTLRILHHMRDGQPHKSIEIRKLTGNPKATTIMYQNHYKWFSNVDKGVYKINDAGKAALTEYESIIKDLSQHWTVPEET